MWEIIKRYLLIWGCALLGLCVASAIVNRKVLAQALAQTFSSIFSVIFVGIILICVIVWLLRLL